MNNIINAELNDKVAKFWEAYREMVNDKNLIKEIKKCTKLYEKSVNEPDVKITDAEEEYIMSLINLTEDVIDSIKNDTGYWNNENE